MTKNETKRVQRAIEMEGFDYTFLSYSDFPEVKDSEFHKRRRAFVAAARSLEEYIEEEEERHGMEG